MFATHRVSWVVAAAAVVALAGCSAGAHPPSAGLEKTSIVVDDFPTVDSAGLYIAKMEGLFADQGLNVTIKFAPFSQAAINAQEKGACDISSADYVTYMDNELTGNAQLRFISEASFLQPNVLSLLVAPNSKFNSISGLKGKTISVAAPNDIATLLVDSLLVEHGISPRDVVFKAGVPLPSVGQALQQGRIDVAPTPEPFSTISEEEFGEQALADPDQGATTNFPIQGYAVTQAWARKYPNTLKAFVRALSQGQQIADTDRHAVERAVEKFLGMPAQTAALIALPDFPVGVDPVRLQRVVDTMAEFGMLPEKDASFKVSSMIDDTASPS